MSRKENALDLAKFVDKAVRVKLSGGREGAHQRVGNAPSHACERASSRRCWVTHLHVQHSVHGTSSMQASKCRHAVEGVLKGYDPLLNLVLDETKEFLRGADHYCGSAAHPHAPQHAQ